MNKNKLKAKMIEYGDTAEKLSKYLGIHRSCLSAKMNGYRGADFNQTEIRMIAQKYNLQDSEIMEIFFDKKAS
jgi:cyanate lyase